MLSLSEALVAPSGGRWEPKIRARFKEAVAAVRLALGDETFTIAWKRGQTMSLDEAIGVAIEPLPVPLASGVPQTALAKVKKANVEKPGGLTSREQEVVNLVSQGLSNKAIGRQLILSERTVEMHVANALHKLGLSSRAQLATWAVHQNLASPVNGVRGPLGEGPMSGVPAGPRTIALGQRRSPGN
jgi:non-specific serine/threonine protein kinase